MPESTFSVTGEAKQVTTGGVSGKFALNIVETIGAHTGQQEFVVPPDDSVAVSLLQLGDTGANILYMRTNRPVKLTLTSATVGTAVTEMEVRGTLLVQTQAVTAAEILNEDPANEASIILFAAKLAS